MHLGYFISPFIHWLLSCPCVERNWNWLNKGQKDNTNYYMFDEIREFSYPAIDINATTTFKAQKGSKDIVKIVHVTSVVQL